MVRFILSLMILLFLLAAEAGQWEKQTFQNIEYEIYKPQKAGIQKAALMITLHGCSQRAHDFARNGNWQEAAEKYTAFIVAPSVPNGGVKMGCWDYYGFGHVASGKHHKAVFQLLAALLKDPKLKVDPRRVYVSGLSSGGGEALLLSCLRPDLFAGVGVASSPAVPSEAHEILNPQLDSSRMIQFCQKLAGSSSGYFSTQMTSVVSADRDFIVSIEHSKIIAEAKILLSKAPVEKELNLENLSGLNTKGNGWEYHTRAGGARVSYIMNNGIGHNWAAGGPPGGAFITQNSINYPLYLLGFFENSNPRLKRNALTE